MPKIQSKDGITYYEFSIREFEAEILHLSGGNVADARQVLQNIELALLSNSEERRRPAQSELARICMGTCHGVAGREHHTPLPEAEQRKLGISF